jgi:hypothetical protein
MTAGAQLLLLAFVLPASIQHAAALGLHAALAATKQGLAAPMPNFDRVRLAQLWSEGDYPLFSRYFASLDDGARALETWRALPARCSCSISSGPSRPASASSRPTATAPGTIGAVRSTRRTTCRREPSCTTFQIVMEPKWPVEVATAEGLRRLYADYLAEHFELARETADWRIHVLRGPPEETVSRSSGSTRTRYGATPRRAAADPPPQALPLE